MDELLLKTALDAVKNAEKIILRHYGSVSPALKEDKSPVTIADKEAERAIIKTIRDKFPDHSFLGEEYGGENSASDYLWIIDPIDGTKNYVRELPFFGTQLALMKNGELVIGVSNLPVLKELSYAERGKGAFLNGKRISVSKVSELNESYVSFGGLKYFNKRNLIGNLLNLVETTRSYRGFGDCWTYHLLAQGRIDAIVEAQVKIWDIAALSVIVEEAGGRITDMKGLQVNKNTDSIIATNGKLHDKILGYFNK